MNGDFSRWTRPNAAWQNYSEVLLQQGRHLSDADWTELSGILSRRSETALQHVIGRTAAPQSYAGFSISSSVANGIRIGTGGYYIDGAWFENSGSTNYADQPGAIELPGAPGDDVIVFLEGFKRHVSALEDSRLSDPALGGVDTCTRLQNAWRVGMETITLDADERADLIASARCGTPPDLPGWGPGTGGLIASTIPEGEPPDDASCLIMPEAGYISQENQTYMIRVVGEGTRSRARWVWSRENGSVQALLDRDPEGAFVLRGDRDDEALGFVSGGWVEVYDEASEYSSSAATLRRITLADGVATFQPPIADFDSLTLPRVRRWDHGGASELGLRMPAGNVTLERGIQVQFATGNYRVGDEWIFEARAATGSIAWPPYPVVDPAAPIPAMSWGRRRAVLALARRNAAGISGIEDVRAIFPGLACLSAADIGFDDTTCQIGVDNVQEAIEALCGSTGGGGLCQITAGSAAELVQQVAILPAGRSVRICLRGAAFALNEGLVLRGLGHVVIEGTGPQTILSVASGESTLIFDNCASVRVTDLSVNGGPVGIADEREQDGRRGAVSLIDCGDVIIERVRARTRTGPERSAACISTFASGTNGQVLVRDCVMRVGQAQIGIQIIGARRAIVENNMIVPVPAAQNRVRGRIAADPALTARIVRGFLRFPDNRPARRGRVSVVYGQGVDRQPGTVSLSNVGNGRQNMRVPFQNRNGAVSAQIDPEVGANMIRMLGANQRGRIGETAEMHSHLKALLAEAIRNGGTVRIGNLQRNIFPDRLSALTTQAYVGQGIVISGQSVDEAQVIGNRIEGAVDGIRIAASGSSDAVPPNWRNDAPGNLVRSAVIERNRIRLNPVSARTASFGIFLGHTETAALARNDITGPGGEGDPDRPRPHYGIYQYGWRGPRVTINENVVQGLHYGYAVLGELDDSQSGLWILRDNAHRMVVVVSALSSGVRVA